MSNFIYLEFISADFRRVLIDQSTIRLLRNEINSQNIYTYNFLVAIDYEFNFLFYYTPYKSKIYLKDIAQKAFYCVKLIFNWHALFLWQVPARIVVVYTQCNAVLNDQLKMFFWL